MANNSVETKYSHHWVRIDRWEYHINPILWLAKFHLPNRFVKSKYSDCDYTSLRHFFTFAGFDNQIGSFDTNFGMHVLKPVLPYFWEWMYIYQLFWGKHHTNFNRFRIMKYFISLFLWEVYAQTSFFRQTETTYEIISIISNQIKSYLYRWITWIYSYGKCKKGWDPSFCR